MNGPSKTFIAASTRFTVVAVRLGPSCSPPLMTPLWESSSHHLPTAAYPRSISSFELRSRQVSSPTNIKRYCGIVISLLHLDDRADFDAVARPGLRELDGGLHVGRLDDAQAADRLLRLDEWAVDDADLAARLPDRRRRARRLQPAA